jgi:hypothetical protein
MRHVDFSRSCSSIALYIVLVRIYLYLIFPQSRLFPEVAHDKYQKIIVSLYNLLHQRYCQCIHIHKKAFYGKY